MAGSFHWTEEKTAELIDLYQERPCLYNTKLKEYHNRDLRKRSIEEMAAALDASGKFIHPLASYN